MAWGEMACEAHEGAGPALVLLHGAGCSMRDWDGVIERLPGDQGWLRLDFRGHGASDVPEAAFSLGELADDVLAAMVTHGIEHGILVGHSLGGMVALDFAKRHAGHEPSALVLLEGWTRLGTSTGAFGPGRFYGGLGPEAIEATRRASEWTRERVGSERWGAFWETVQAADGEAWLAEAGVPVYEVHGAEGRLPESERLLSVPESPWIRWRWIEGAGHYLPTAGPEGVAAVCVEALREVRGR